MGTVQTSFRLDEELWRAVKKAAIDSGMSMGSFIVEAVKEKLGLKEEKQA